MCVEEKLMSISLKGQTLYLVGEVNFHNAMSLYRDSLKHLYALPSYHFDFSQVKKSNSAGLALIFEWIKLAKAQGKSVYFSGIDAHLLSVARAADCEGLINRDRIS